MSQKTSNSKTAGDHCHWKEIFTQLQDDGVEFFMNSQSEPNVFIPTDGFRKTWPADSQRVGDLLMSMHYERNAGAILRSPERDFMMGQIREECRRGGRRLTEIEARETDKDVIVQAILALLNNQPKFSGLMVVLVKLLRKIQADAKISFSEEIPIFTNIFSRKLNRLIPVLRGYGVVVEVEHRESGSHCTLTRLESFQREPLIEDIRTDGFANESSGQSSDATTMNGKELPPTDGADGEFRTDPPQTVNAKQSTAAPSVRGEE